MNVCVRVCESNALQKEGWDENGIPPADDKALVSATDKKNKTRKGPATHTPTHKKKPSAEMLKQTNKNQRACKESVNGKRVSTQLRNRTALFERRETRLRRSLLHPRTSSSPLQAHHTHTQAATAHTVVMLASSPSSFSPSSSTCSGADDDTS